MSHFDKIKKIVEVLIFASDMPISVKQIQGVMEDAKPRDIEKIIDTLNSEYQQTGRTFTIVQVAGGYQMVSRNSYYQWIRKLFHRKIKSRLSQAALETLSVVAFKQPVSKPEVEAVRGVNCDGVIRTLLERKLVALSGRGEGPGRPLLYKTTDEFLRYFGINDISDLPKPREIEEILKEEKLPEEVEGLEALEAVNGQPDTGNQETDSGTGNTDNAGENAGDRHKEGEASKSVHELKKPASSEKTRPGNKKHSASGFKASAQEVPEKAEVKDAVE
ncbi:SMC-Scp complex subunit ScpB [bacterium]|nr:SMC-Scp complex subunit ScpB [bacterium]